MKKALLASVSAAALFATPAFAQSNQSTIDQSGTTSQAYVNQQSVSSQATIEQDGQDDWASVQQGTVNANATGNKATVRQTGSGTASVPAIDTPPANYVEGVSNYATVRQDGSNGTVLVDQTGNNRADVTQQGGAGNYPGTLQTATVTQTSNPADGAQNYTSINQSGTSVDAVSTQTGRGNNAQIAQTVGSDRSEWRFRSGHDQRVVVHHPNGQLQCS